MIENFNNIYLFILYVVFLGLIGVYCFRMWFYPSGVLKEFNIGKEGTYLVRVIGTFVFAFLFMGYTYYLDPLDLQVLGYFSTFVSNWYCTSFIYAFYFKFIDKDIGAKNSIVDVLVGLFFVVGSIILIIGLSDKIYAFS